MTYRMLAFDGGPPISTALRTLIKIEEAHPGFLAKTDHFIGSSAGAITSLYIARRLRDGEEALSILRGALAMTERLFGVFSPADREALGTVLGNLVVGASAMMGNRSLRRLLEEELGPGTLGDLDRRVTILSTAKAEPYEPTLWSNFPSRGTKDHSDLSLVDAGMHTSAFPFWVPVRGGQVDGCMWNNSPGMAGLSAAIGAAGSRTARAKLLEEGVLLQLGAMDGMCSLSNEYLPGDPLPSAPSRPPEGAPSKVRITDATERADLDEAVAYGLYVQNEVRDTLMQRVFRPPKPQADPDGRTGRLIMRVGRLVGRVEDRLKAALRPAKDRAAQEQARRKAETDDALPGNESWGWVEWIAYPANPVYILQQWLNSLGRGAELASRNLLGERSLRVGPVTFLGTNTAELCVLFGRIDAILYFAELSAELWGNPVTSERFGFEPGWGRTDAWVRAHWM